MMTLSTVISKPIDNASGGYHDHGNGNEFAVYVGSGDSPSKRTAPKAANTIPRNTTCSATVGEMRSVRFNTMAAPKDDAEENDENAISSRETSGCSHVVCRRGRDLGKREKPGQEYG